MGASHGASVDPRANRAEERERVVEGAIRGRDLIARSHERGKVRVDERGGRG